MDTVGTICDESLCWMKCVFVREVLEVFLGILAVEYIYQLVVVA